MHVLRSRTSRKSRASGTAIAAQQSMDAAGILDEFAALARRYLWTDAIAVMTWIGLYERTGERRFLDLAQRLIVDARAPAHGLRVGRRAVPALGGRTGRGRPPCIRLPRGREELQPLFSRVIEDVTLSAQAGTWTGHRDINAVSLAACLAPEGVLG